MQPPVSIPRAADATLVVGLPWSMLSMILSKKEQGGMSCQSIMVNNLLSSSQFISFAYTSLLVELEE